jgi:hypothetical protein
VVVGAGHAGGASLGAKNIKARQGECAGILSFVEKETC